MLYRSSEKQTLTPVRSVLSRGRGSFRITIIYIICYFEIRQNCRIVYFKKALKCLIRLFSNCQPGTNRQQILQDALQDLSMNPPESKSREKVLVSTVRTHLPWQEKMFYLYASLYSILCILRLKSIRLLSLIPKKFPTSEGI